MRILVCVKSVPETESSFRVNREGNAYDDSGLKFKVNEYDLCAVEEAVRIKERLGDARITIVSVGPKRVEEQIKKAMGLGAGYGVRIDESAAPAQDALSIASLIAAWARPQQFDLVLAGVMSEDLQRCQVGPMLAQILDLPCATTVVKMDFSKSRKKIICERELEGGTRERVELSLPALVTIQSGINIPRYGSLSNVLRVKKMEIPVVPASELGKARSSEKILRASISAPASACEFLDGNLNEVADELIGKIRSRLHIL